MNQFTEDSGQPTSLITNQQEEEDLSQSSEDLQGHHHHHHQEEEEVDARAWAYSLFADDKAKSLTGSVTFFSGCR